MYIKYFVENPNNDPEKNYRNNLITVEVKIADAPVVTKTRQMGIAVKAVITASKGGKYYGHAVCVPEDEFSFKQGGKLALGRALEKGTYLKKTRTSIWVGFFKSLIAEQEFSGGVS